MSGAHTMGVKEYIENILFHIPELDGDSKVVTLKVQEDSFHMGAVICPIYAVAHAVNYIKSKSARRLKAKFPFLSKVYFSIK
jgi:REP element-mobilizing transposase RayT